MTPVLITAELGVELLHHGVPVPLVMAMEYTEDDPCAIHVYFHAGTTDAVEWLIDRELLAWGLAGREPAGQGDVTIVTYGEYTRLHLRSNTGAADMTMRAAQVRAFLDKTYQAIPASAEAAIIGEDLDLELLAIFAEEEL